MCPLGGDIVVTLGSTDVVHVHNEDVCFWDLRPCTFIFVIRRPIFVDGQLSVWASNKGKGKGKNLSCYRPGVAQRVPGS